MYTCIYSCLCVCVRAYVYKPVDSSYGLNCYFPSSSVAVSYTRTHDEEWRSGRMKERKKCLIFLESSRFICSRLHFCRVLYLLSDHAT